MRSTRMATGRRRERATTMVVAVLLALVMGGCSAVGAEQSAEENGSTPAPGSRTTPAPDDSPETPRFMPDLIGESYEEARRQLVALNVQVTRKDKIAAQDEGTVIAQSPEPGEDFAQRVELTVSISPPDVPDVTGLPFGEATRELERLGFDFVETPVFDEQERDGVVLSQDPPAGATNAGLVQLEVSRRPIVRFISDLEPVSSSDDTRMLSGTASTNGEPYTHALTLGVSQFPRTPVAEVEFDLSRDYRQLVGAVGLDDRAAGGTSWKVEIYGDDRNLFSEVVEIGQTVPVDLDVTDVLRLEIVATRIDGAGPVVFADVRALGLDAEVDEPSPSPSASGDS